MLLPLPNCLKLWSALKFRLKWKHLNVKEQYSVFYFWREGCWESISEETKVKKERQEKFEYQFQGWLRQRVRQNNESYPTLADMNVRCKKKYNDDGEEKIISDGWWKETERERWRPIKREMRTKNRNTRWERLKWVYFKLHCVILSVIGVCGLPPLIVGGSFCLKGNMRVESSMMKVSLCDRCLFEAFK